MAQQSNNDRPNDYRQQQEKLKLSEADWRRILCAKGVEGVLKKKKEIEDEWKKQRVLIAVVGQTGSGKSTIIHRLLGYQPGDQNGPVVGESVTECTKEAKEYLKEGTGLVYIDLPGIGSTTTTYAFSTRNDQDMYCTRFRLQTIDYFLLVSQNKFNNQEKLLADYITQILKKKFLFVQTKMDLLRKEYGNQIIEDNEGFDVVKTMIRTDIQKQLRLNTAERIFLVSNDVIKVRVDGQQRRTYDTSPDYEYDLLLKQIQDDMLGEEGLNNGIREELESLREASQTHLKRFLDMILVLLRDFCDIDSIMGGQMNEQKVCLSQPEKEIKYSDIFWKPTIENLDQAEEECTLSCLYLSKLKAEARSISGRLSELELEKVDHQRSIGLKYKELDEARLLIQQHEAEMRSMLESIKELEEKKCTLEQIQDLLNEESVKICAQGGVAGSSSDVQKELNQQMEQISEQHQKQLTTFRDEIRTEETQMETLKDSLQKLQLSYEKLSNDYEKLKKEEIDKSNLLQEMTLQQDLCEQAKQDLKSFEENVAKELQTLHNLQKLFFQDLQSQKQPEIKEDDLGGSVAQKQKISFLENNLDQLTKVHKQLVRENADLRCELPKLEKRLEATMDRVKSLEQALKEAKESAMEDRKRYQCEVDRIKEAVRQRNIARRTNAAQIVEPILAGVNPSTNTSTPIPTIPGDGGNQSIDQ